MSLAGHSALVTGAGRNLGRAIALRLGAAGAHVLCAYRDDEDAATMVCGEIRAAGGAADPLRLDLDAPSLVQPFAEATALAGTVDVLVHNAAIRPHAAVNDVSAEDWDRTQRINVRGPFLLSQAAAAGMRAACWGRIVFIGGLDAYWSGPELTQVTTTKLAAVGLARGLAGELGRWGITVNTVVSGPLAPSPLPPAATQRWLERIPLGRLGERDDVAATCAFLASDEAGFITGQEIFVTGGAMPLVGRPHTDKGAIDGPTP